MYLVQKTQIFKPRAASTPVQISIPEVCTPGSYALDPIYITAPGLNVSWNIPHTGDDNSCNVFIHDNSTNLNYSVSKGCLGATSVTTLSDLDGTNPDTAVKEGVTYTLFVSNGDTNSCYNKAVANADTTRIPPSHAPAENFFRPVTGMSDDEILRYRSLGFYPVSEENGDIALLNRVDYVRYICQNNDACVPRESPTLERAKNDPDFLKALMTKLFEKGYAPIPTLREYFLTEIDELISLNSNSDVLKAFQNEEINVIGLPRLDNSQDQFETKIDEEELLKIIKDVAHERQLYKFETELQANEQLPWLNYVLDYTEPFFGTRAAISFFALLPYQASPETRIFSGLGVLGVFLPAGGPAKQLGNAVKSKVLSKSLKVQQLISDVQNFRAYKAAVNEPYPLSRLVKRLKTDPSMFRDFAQSKLTVRLRSLPAKLNREIYINLQRYKAGTDIFKEMIEYNKLIASGRAYVLNPGIAQELSTELVNGLKLYSDGILMKRGLIPSAREISKVLKDNPVAVVDNELFKGLCSQCEKAGGFQANGIIVLPQSSVIDTATGKVKDDLFAPLQHEMVHLLNNINTGIGKPKLGFILSYDDGEQYGKLMTIIYELYTDRTTLLASGRDPAAYRYAYPELWNKVQSAINRLVRESNGRINEVDFVEFALTGNDRNLVTKLGNFNNLSELINLFEGVDSLTLKSKWLEFAQQAKLEEIRRLATIGILESSVIYLRNEVFAKQARGENIQEGTVIVNIPPLDTNSGTSTNLPVSNIFLNYNRAARGGNPDILGRTEPTRISLDRNTLCGSSQYQNSDIGVRHSNSPADGSGDIILTVRFKLSGNVKQTICADSSPGGIASTLSAPSSITHQCLNNNSVARVSWNGNGTGYDIRVEGDGASYSKRDCPPHSVCVNNYTSNSIDINIKPNTVNNLWMNAMAERNGKREVSEIAKYDNFRCPQISLEKPKIINASCNRTTLNLSWYQVGNITTYQMRGVNTSDSSYYPTLDGTINGADDPSYLNKLGDKAKELISNNQGEDVSCYQNVCSYSKPGLNTSFKYRVWVNAKDGDQKSNNAYFPQIVDCDYQEPGNSYPKPEDLKASCINGHIKLSWGLQNNAGGSLPYGFTYRVRGLQTDDLNYFPPENWIDGIDPKRIISNGNEPNSAGSGGDWSKGYGTNITCGFGAQGTGWAVCTYQETDQDPKRTGKYRVWVDAKESNKSIDSKNSYFDGLVDCGS